MPTTEERESAVAEKLMKNADGMLALIDDAFIVKERGHEPRKMPTFRPEEISLGKVLGVGGFGIVNEIRKITLDPSFSASVGGGSASEEPRRSGSGDAADKDKNNDNNSNDCEASKDELDGGESVPRANGSSEQEPDNDGAGEAEQAAAAAAAAGGGGGGKGELHVKLQDLRLSNLSSCTDASHHGRANRTDNFHYEISKARRVMSKRCLRKGVSRYAIKRLHTGDLSKLEKSRGMIDLAAEAKYLSVVWHPNIIKMRGMAAGPLVDPDFFIILDRLFLTLDQKINEWFQLNKKYQGKFLGFGKKKRAIHDLMVDRMTVAYDLAAAFFYLHENRLVYRDIKPENIGFDVRGDVKIFDFGLCKSLSPALKAREGKYGYRLTGRAGSLPYMAPEVIKMETYDTKCDVYSFSILLWEILNLQQSFKGMSPSQFVEEVVVKKTRLPVPTTIPPLTRLMIPEAWDDDPRQRPDMKRCAILIRGDLNDMTCDDAILHRTTHMDNRSDHSDRGAMLRGGPPPTQDAHLDFSDDES